MKLLRFSQQSKKINCHLKTKETVFHLDYMKEESINNSINKSKDKIHHCNNMYSQ